MLRTYFNDGSHFRLGPGYPGTSNAGSAPWLDLINPTHEEERQVEALVGVNVPTREEMKDIEVSARLYQEDGAEFMTITAREA